MMDKNYVLLVVSLVLLTTSILGAATTITRMPDGKGSSGRLFGGRWFQLVASCIAASAAIIYSVFLVNH